MRYRSKHIVLLLAALLVSLLPIGTQLQASPAAHRDNSELDTRLARLPVFTTIAYITAHPDDESGPVIAYLARALHARVVILCLTRGEGGQNLTGPELDVELGWVRTRELEAAAAIYGAEVRFLDAPDFGYSKSVEETLARWEEPKLLERLVRALRELKPDVVISRWTPEASSGAQHQAAGILAQQAFAAMGTSSAFPEHLVQGLVLWPARYFLTHSSSAEEEETLRVPVEEVDASTGKTYEELGWEGLREHRSQGLDRSQFSPGRQYYLRVDARRMLAPELNHVRELVQPLTALPVVFPTVGILPAWEERLAEVVALAQAARTALIAEESAEAALKLVQAAALLNGLRRELLSSSSVRDELATRLSEQQASAFIGLRLEEFLRAAAAVAGVEFEALADRATVTPGKRFWVRLSLRVGALEVFQNVGLEMSELRLVAPSDWLVEPVAAEVTPTTQVSEFNVTVPASLNPLAVPRPPLEAEAWLALRRPDAAAGPLRVPLRAVVHGLATSAEPVGAALARLEPLTLAPPLTLALEPRLRLIPTTQAAGTVDWQVRIQSHRTDLGDVSVWLEVPQGWYSPLPQSVSFARDLQYTTLRFQMLLPERLPPASHTLRARASVAGTIFEFMRVGASAAGYRYQPAVARIEVIASEVPRALRIGYIGFNDDPVPALLAQLGIVVDMLDPHALATAKLAPYDAIVIAERAYDFREDLPAQTPRLLKYVQSGGTLVVEHQSWRAWQRHQPTPYPATMPAGRNLRVADETSPVRILVPDHPGLNFPNRLTPEDFNGWVHERGLYFLGEWDARFTPLLELADPGEEPLRGSLLYARYGAGVYIYTGLALFRQVRAGVSGGIRLFVNLLSQSRQRF